MSIVEFEPAAYFDLGRSARALDGVTRRFRNGVLEVQLAAGRGEVRQRADGSLRLDIDADDNAAAERALRFQLGCDESIEDFIGMARHDTLLAPVVRRAPGVRVIRVETIAHAAIQAFAGQLITFQEAQQIERRILRAARSGPHDALVPSPTAEQVLALGTARIVSCGLAQRRADALMRLLGGLDLERLRELEPARVAARLARESQVGPWTIGVLGLHGYGWHDHGLVGDLGLMRVATATLGRAATADDTAALLAPYAPWRGLASVHLLAHPLARKRH